jgi:aminoglycoside phosphotransferase family enzyme/predicted kinase
LAVDVDEILRDLSRPEAWPWPAGAPGAPGAPGATGAIGSVECVQTHVSIVFLAGERVLKLKKPRDLGFLDFTSRRARLEACAAECRLNARLAPGVYLGVVTVARSPDGWRVFERPPKQCEHGEQCEHGQQCEDGEDGEEPAVLMHRLPADRTMAAMLERGELRADDVERVALRIARFHDTADAGEEVKAASRFEPLRRVVRGNLEQLAAFAGETLEPELHERLVREIDRELAAVAGLVESRADGGLGRDGHGDLRLDHVYLLGGAIDVVDCIEFRDDFRRGDPVADAAFLVMELEHARRPDLAATFFGAWAAARRDGEAAALLPLHVAHRRLVRAKVRSLAAREPEIPKDERRRAAEEATTHAIAALVRVAPPSRRPALLVACGLPCSGKSTLARGLAADGFARISSDETRKSLAAWLSPPDTWEGGHEGGLYGREWTDRTYRACFEQAEALLRQGRRVVLDASFHEESRRREALELAGRLGVAAVAFECRASDPVADARMAARRGDASDATPAIRAAMIARWEAPNDAETARWTAWRTVDSTSPEADIAAARTALGGIAPSLA